MPFEDLIGAGEGQSTEFKSQFPAQARDLAKEVAAFASSNDGVILIGVADDGSTPGLEDSGSPAEKDAWRRRIQGACAAVKPPVTPRLVFGEIEGATVVCLHVARGAAPVYYVHHVPYVRDQSSSRPAEPQEVIDRVEAWLKRGAPPESAENEFLSQISGFLVTVIARSSEVHERSRAVTPWFSELRMYLELNANTARDYALNTPAALSDLEPSLEALAEALDAAAHEDLGLNFGWTELRQHADQARTLASEIKATWIDVHPITVDSIAEIEALAAAQSKALASLANRADGMASGGRIKDLQSEAGNLGWTLLVIALCGVGFRGPETRARLEPLARRLRVVETMDLYMDGGKSQRRIVDETRAVSAALQDLLSARDPAG